MVWVCLPACQERSPWDHCVETWLWAGSLGWHDGPGACQLGGLQVVWRWDATCHSLWKLFSTLIWIGIGYDFKNELHVSQLRHLEFREFLLLKPNPPSGPPPKKVTWLDKFFVYLHNQSCVEWGKANSATTWTSSSSSDPSSEACPTTSEAWDSTSSTSLDAATSTSLDAATSAACPTSRSEADCASMEATTSTRSRSSHAPRLHWLGNFHIEPVIKCVASKFVKADFVTYCEWSRIDCT